jgi:hypothetical protein
MLLILIPTAWLALLTLIVIVCKIAARGDEMLGQRVTGAEAHTLDGGLRLFEQAPAVASRLRIPASEHRLGVANRPSRSTVRAHEARSRRSSFVAGP